MIDEYRQLRSAAVVDIEGYINACHAMLRLGEEPMIDELAQIDCATLVIAGENDPYCPPKASRMIADAIPGARLEIIPEVGHCLHWESSERTNALIQEFIHQHEVTA